MKTRKIENGEMPHPEPSAHILVIDDEKNIRLALSACLEAAGYRIHAASSSQTAIAALEEKSFDIAFLDLKLGQEDGLKVIPMLLEKSPGLQIIMITAFATFETAVEAIKLGAFDYLPKPFSPDQIRHVVKRASQAVSLRYRVSNLEAQLREACPEADFETQSSKMRKALETIRQAANSSAPVLLRGESGTGKSLFARFFHSQSPRAGRTFVTVNCPILQESLLASELFGHAKGAFTGAVKDQAGKVESADGGTLFLDEIGEIPSSLQAKLLRFLQEKQFERIGETRVRKADARIICATNRNLEEDVKNGRFREDLLFRINVLEIAIPPLRERSEDISALANRFLAFFAREQGRSSVKFSKEVEGIFQNYSWPGNIRELRNVIERALIVCSGNEITPTALPERLGTSEKLAPLIGGNHSLEAVENEHLLRVIKRTSTLEEAAEILKIDASTLWRKRKKLEEAKD